MAWDDSKSTFQQRPDVPDDEKLTADEWNAHVADQKDHNDRHEDGGSDELNVAGLSGVLADAQTPQTEAVQDIVGALIAANGNISVTYDDGADTLTIDTSALNEEEVEDAVAALVTAGNAITVNYDDANNTLSIAVDESALSFYDGTNLTAPVDNQSVNTDDSRPKRIADEYHYAGEYDGATADGRFEAALSAANDDETIYLEAENYENDHTVSKQVTVIGTSINRSRFTGADITLAADRVTIKRVNFDSASAVFINNSDCRLMDAFASTATSVTVSANRVLFGGLRGFDITFESGNSAGLVDSSTGTAFTDNDGGNTQGDIA